MSTVQLESTITCPKCHHSELLTMAEDSCQIFYHCPACGSQLRPKANDCCVFCTYGAVPCPPIQRERGGNQVEHDDDAEECS